MTRVLYSDYIGPARLRLNLPEVAPELKRVCHPCSKVKFTSSYGNRRFSARDQGSHWGFSAQICFFIRPGFGLIMKNRVKSEFFEVINLSATSMYSTVWR